MASAGIVDSHNKIQGLPGRIHHGFKRTESPFCRGSSFDIWQDKHSKFADEEPGEERDLFSFTLCFR